MTTIRQAIADDAEALALLADQTFRDAFAAQNDPSDIDLHCATHYSPDRQLDEIRDRRTITLVADLDGVLIAYAQLRHGSYKECVPAERPWELSKFYVAQQWHGRGVAHEVMREVLALAAQEGADSLWLGVWTENLRAIAFYRKYDFAVVGSQIFQVGTDPQQDFVMAVRVGGQSTDSLDVPVDS
ncbi:MAG: GNAT family N-acetyltransferase [Pseudomonadota bacterium]